MGWWSATILGGDVPLDTMYDLVQSFCGYTKEWDGWDGNLKAMKEGLENTTEQQLLTFIGKAYSPAIAAQCVAYAHMVCGAKFPVALREIAVKTCDNEDTSRWDIPEKREVYLDQFSEMIQKYDDSTPQRPKEEHLFEVFARRASERQKKG